MILDTDGTQQQAVEAQLGVFVSAFAQGLSDHAHCQRAASHLLTVLAGSKNLRAAAAPAISAKAVFAQTATFPDDPETLAARDYNRKHQPQHSFQPHRIYLRWRLSSAATQTTKLTPPAPPVPRAFRRAASLRSTQCSRAPRRRRARASSASARRRSSPPPSPPPSGT